MARDPNFGRLTDAAPQTSVPTPKHAHASERTGGNALYHPTLVDATGTLTAVTLTAPHITGGTMSGVTVQQNDNVWTLIDASTPARQIVFDVQGGLAAAYVLIVPAVGDDTLALLAATQTLTNKTLTTPTIGDFTNAPHNHILASGGNTVDHTSLTSKGTNTHATIDAAVTASTAHIAATAAHGATGAVVGTTNTQTVQNKSLTNGLTFMVDGTDATKRLLFATSGATTGANLTLASAATTNRTVTFPDATGVLATTTAPTTWTPTVSQSAAVTLTVQFARYQVLGKMAYVQARLTLTGGGTGGNQFIVNGIPAGIAPTQPGSHVPVGTFVYYDASASYYQGAVIAVGANDLRFVTNNNGAAGVYFGNVPSMTLANGDELNFTAQWEIA